MYTDGNTRDLVNSIRQANYDQLSDMVMEFEAKYLYYKLLMELAKSKKDGANDYFEYLLDHISNKHPASSEP